MPNVETLRRRFTALHAFILLLSLTMTVGAWQYSERQLQAQIENRFLAARDRTVGLIVERMSRYEDALWSGVAAIEARDGKIAYEEWKAFSRSLNIREKYPGVNGVGVIYYVDRDDLPAFKAGREAEQRDFSIYPGHVQDFLLPITFIEPEGINAAAIGLDVAHETNRRTGLLASRDTGEARITGPIVLVQDSGHTPGFLFYTPFYKGDVPATVADRRERFSGVVYAPFIVKNLVDGLLSKDLRGVRFSIRDGDDVIYDEHGQTEQTSDPDPMFTDTIDLDLYGRTWVVDIRTNRDFRDQNSSNQPVFILFGGLIIEALIVALLVLLMKSNQRAHDYAHQLTQELRQESESLERANAEIEQFAYVASHDLKTPTRGISYLTDLLEEDLEAMVGPVESHAGIKQHLNLVRDRVARMNDLTTGIMKFSRVGYKFDDSPGAAPLKAILTDCVSDFGVHPDQIRYDGPADFIAPDNQNFRCVMENLIGNALKYHPSRDTAQVVVRADYLGDTLRISVRDNGDGIAPEFHEKIFDVFQTLRHANAPDSTGIGLAIVKKAVERHGYSVSVRSSQGDGAEFIFEWPSGQDRSEPDLKDVA